MRRALWGMVCALVCICAVAAWVAGAPSRGAAQSLTHGGYDLRLFRHAVDSNLVFFDDLVVPLDDRIGEEGNGFRMILHGLNPLHTGLLWAPSGYSTTWITSVPALALLAAPVTLLAGPLVSYNLLMLAALYDLNGAQDQIK